MTQILAEPNGIILVTGPTGSGKTTTLYTALSLLNSTQRKTFTVEDPIEYQLDGVNQIQVQPKIGLSFASILRSVLRQDPDTIMVGEIRDLETARVAIQASLTGHLVLSTVHTNSAAATVTRLLDMGVESYLLASTLKAVLAQRLVRRLCGQCASPAEASPGAARQPQAGRAGRGCRKRTSAAPSAPPGWLSRLPPDRLSRPHNGQRAATDDQRRAGSGAERGHRTRHPGRRDRRRHDRHVPRWRRQSAGRRNDAG